MDEYSFPTIARKIKQLLKRIYYEQYLKIVNRNSKIYEGKFGLKYHCFKKSALDAHIMSNGVLPEYICTTNQPFIPSKDCVIFDVGANVGFISCVLAKRYAEGGVVHSYEPDPLNAQQLSLNVKLNSLENMHVHQMALQDDENIESIDFNIRRLLDGDNNENRGISSLLDIELGRKSKKRVVASTIDKEILRLKLKKLDFIKIDVKGAESLVLKGAYHSILKYKPVIQYELSNVIDKLAGVNNTATSFEFLKNQNYRQFCIQDETNLIELFNVDDNMGDTNVLCFHTSKMPNFLS